MLTTIFYVAVLWVTFKLLILGIRITMGFFKAFLTVLFFPVIVIGLFLLGFIKISLVILAVAAVVSLFSRLAEN